MGETQQERNDRISREENERAADLHEIQNNCGTCNQPLSACKGHG